MAVVGWVVVANRGASEDPLADHQWVGNLEQLVIRIVANDRYEMSTAVRPYSAQTQWFLGVDLSFNLWQAYWVSHPTMQTVNLVEGRSQSIGSIEVDIILMARYVTAVAPFELHVGNNALLKATRAIVVFGDARRDRCPAPELVTLQLHLQRKCNPAGLSEPPSWTTQRKPCSIKYRWYWWSSHRCRYQGHGAEPEDLRMRCYCLLLGMLPLGGCENVSKCSAIHQVRKHQ